LLDRATCIPAWAHHEKERAVLRWHALDPQRLFAGTCRKSAFTGTVAQMYFAQKPILNHEMERIGKVDFALMTTRPPQNFWF
jgi:hypothetical protein